MKLKIFTLIVASCLSQACKANTYPGAYQQSYPYYYPSQQAIQYAQPAQSKKKNKSSILPALGVVTLVTGSIIFSGLNEINKKLSGKKGN